MVQELAEAAMKAKRKRLIGRSLYVLLMACSIAKVYLEADSFYFERRLSEMIKSNELDVELNGEMVSKLLHVNECDIHYKISKTEHNQTVVFLHPAFSDCNVFNEQFDFFSKEFNVIAIDLLGHGLSKANKSKDKLDASRDHISKVLEREQIDEVNFVGVSVGSLIAQHFALKYPQKVKTLTALGGYDINKDNSDVAKAQRSVSMGLVFRALFSMKSFRKKTAEITCKSEKGQALFYLTTVNYRRSSFPIMQGLKNVVKNRDNCDLKMPTLILAAEFDVELAKKMAIDWHSGSSNSEYYMINDAGHCANLDQPKEFNRLVRDFLDRNN